MMVGQVLRADTLAVWVVSVAAMREHKNLPVGDVGRHLVFLSNTFRCPVCSLIACPLHAFVVRSINNAVNLVPHFHTSLQITVLHLTLLYSFSNQEFMIP